MTLNTLPSLRTSSSRDNSTLDNSTDVDISDELDGDNVYLSLTEGVCVCYMAVEYVARLWASPARYVLVILVTPVLITTVAGVKRSAASGWATVRLCVCLCAQ